MRLIRFFKSDQNNNYLRVTIAPCHVSSEPLLAMLTVLAQCTDLAYSAYERTQADHTVLRSQCKSYHFQKQFRNAMRQLRR